MHDLPGGGQIETSLYLLCKAMKEDATVGISGESADEVFGGIASAVDAWFAAWAEQDAVARDTALRRVTSPDVRFRDRFSVVDGAVELSAQIAAYHQFMPGLRIARDGDLRRCQGTVLVDWIARDADGTERGRGTNVFTLNRQTRI